VAGILAPTNRELVELVADSFRREPPRLIGSDERLGELAPYLAVRAVFDDSRARELLSDLGLHAPPIDVYFDRLLAYAEDTRWGRAPTSREEARRRHPVSVGAVAS
jgi:hypothetical protein